MLGQQIEQVLSRKCSKNFLGVFARDRLPARLPTLRPLLLVANTDPHYKTGEHWIAIYIGARGRGEYFDSYGEKPPSLFSSFLDKHSSDWIINSSRIQSVIRSSCGQYCIFYCLLKYMGVSMKDILNCFIPEDTALNDLIVNTFVSQVI